MKVRRYYEMFNPIVCLTLLSNSIGVEIRLWGVSSYSLGLK